LSVPANTDKNAADIEASIPPSVSLFSLAGGNSSTTSIFSSRENRTLLGLFSFSFPSFSFLIGNYSVVLITSFVQVPFSQEVWGNKFFNLQDKKASE
jgi:hypothetical protein